MNISRTLITDTKALADFCDRLKDTPYITVDTEFMRERTYWPVLCLIQVAGPDEARGIDAMADGIDLAPLLDLFANEDILKVFHAGRQDLEIFFNLMDKLPHPVFDTQVAAMVCGFGDQVGYETLIARLTKARIDKSSRFTDWSLRPLSDKQIDYALDDVIHLRDAYESLKVMLHENGRENWLVEEMETLTARKTYDPDPMESWKRVKSRGAKPRALATLRELAAWRELEAQKRDMPKNRIIRDEALAEIAHQGPTTTKELARTRGLSQGQAEGSMGKAILKAVERGLAVPKADWPSLPKKPDMPEGIGPLSDLMKVLLKMKCQQMGVAQKLVASSNDVEKIAAFGRESDVAAIHGWRSEVFGNDALKLRDGEIALAGDKDGLRIISAI